jgi:hypothetical protein
MCVATSTTSTSSVSTSSTSTAAPARADNTICCFNEDLSECKLEHCQE